jgi:hypothetical protein
MYDPEDKIDCFEDTTYWFDAWDRCTSIIGPERVRDKCDDDGGEVAEPAAPKA